MMELGEFSVDIHLPATHVLALLLVSKGESKSIGGSA
jgi:hypothetical protein